MRIVLSFDDGRLDTFTEAFPILKDNGLTASVHITTGFIDGSFKTDEFGKGMKPIPIGALKEMFDYGIDISSHGDFHKMEANDFFKSKEKLSLWTSSDCKIGFSVPNSSASEAEIKEFINETSGDPLYVRVGRDKSCRSFINKINYIFYKLFHFQVSFNSFNKNNINYSLDKFYIKSCVIKRHTRAKSIIKFIKKYSRKDCVFVLMFHSVLEKPTNDWEWDKKEFQILCAKLAEMKRSKSIDVLNLSKLIIG